jgi:hypothetical protein
MVLFQNPWKLRLFGADPLHTNGQADMTKLIVAFRNFANAPKMYVTRNIYSYLTSNLLDVSGHCLFFFCLFSEVIFVLSPLILCISFSEFLTH